MTLGTRVAGSFLILLLGFILPHFLLIQTDQEFLEIDV